MAAHPGAADALAALFRSPGALFLQRVAAPVDLSEEDAQIRWLCADREELSGGRPIDLGRGPLPDCGFLRLDRTLQHATHLQHLDDCRARVRGGLPVRAGGVIFASQAQARVRELRACPAPQ